MVIWPEYISLKRWAAELIASYPEEFLPILIDEEKWKEWGTIVCSTGVFAKANIPKPFTAQDSRKITNFQKWEDWAKVFYNKMSIQYDIDNQIIV